MSNGAEQGDLAVFIARATFVVALIFVVETLQHSNLLLLETEHMPVEESGPRVEKLLGQARVVQESQYLLRVGAH